MGEHGSSKPFPVPFHRKSLYRTITGDLPIMAIILLSDPYAGYRGRTSVVGGGVISPRGNRFVRRTFVQPSNPNSSDQQTMRSALTAASQAYSDISDFNRAAWDQLSIDLPRTDPDGNTYFQTAMGLYTGVQVMRILDGQAILDTAPPAIVQAAPTSLGTVEINIAQTDVVFSWGFDDPGAQWYLQRTPALPGTARQPRQTDFRKFGGTFPESILTDATTPGTATFVIADLSFPIAAGDRIGQQITAYSPGYVKGQSRFQDRTVTQEV